MNEPEIIDNISIEENKNRTNEGNNDKRFVNDSSIFYKGLFGLILCLTPGSIIGLVLVKMSIEQSSEAIKIYSQNSEQYDVRSIKKVKSGRIMAYIGLGLFIAEIILLVTYMSYL